MLFFPLSILVGVVGARRWPLVWAMTASAALFAVAVVVAWQVQGFPPSPRDLAWLALAWGATWISSRVGRRRTVDVAPTPAEP